MKRMKDVLFERLLQLQRCLAINAFSAERIHANKRSQWAQNLRADDRPVSFNDGGHRTA